MKMWVEVMSGDIKTYCICVQAGLKVNVIAYGGSKANASITADQNIHIHTIPEP